MMARAAWAVLAVILISFLGVISLVGNPHLAGLKTFRSGKLEAELAFPLDFKNILVEDQNTRENTRFVILEIENYFSGEVYRRVHVREYIVKPGWMNSNTWIFPRYNPAIFGLPFPVFTTNHSIASDSNCLSRALPVVGYSYLEFELFSRSNVAGNHLKPEIGPDLSFAYLAGVEHSSASNEQRVTNVVHPDGRDGDGQGRRNEHVQGPTRHFLLGGQISLGALMLVGGFYYLANTFGLGSAINSDTGAVYVGLSVASIFIGALLFVSGAFAI